MEVVFNTFYCNFGRGEENGSLYRELRCIDVLYHHALILCLNKEKAKSNYHSRSPILNVEACFDTLDEKCSVEKNWMFSCRQGPRNVFACVFRHCCPCQIGQSILTKSFLFTRMSERPRHFDRLSTLATKSGSLSNIYSICTRLRFKKTNAVFQKCKLQWKCHKTFLSDSAIFYQKQSKQFPIYSPQ